ncbi:hypothetical protein HII31_06516 [Pseudocercospora fuligena]|uniref:Uncharacterized protein n=1 Tax=Pseudocercospora fuligena TaxID=685502 RepID=A0A8H6VHV5_9PEZI|nr:hypothetical protein HII31_06516 [Pseudocercospora fuligena]
MSTTDSFAALRTNITNAFSSLFSFHFSFVFPWSGRGQLQDATLPKTPPPKWRTRTTYMPEPDVNRTMMSSYLMKLAPASHALRDPIQVPANFRNYTPEGAKYAEEMDVFEDVFQAPTPNASSSQTLSMPAFHLARPPPAPDSWREHIASKRPPPSLPSREIHQAAVAVQKRKRAEGPVRNKRGRSSRRGESGEPARKKARL